ncbi:MAG TPA: extracellular solute-binding protein [Candidatus Accumulibacter phosphatis]|nr:MAG: sn-glycerol-3-phosphate-binding periplasmic protein UgpB precursor [Candidatus Accumulibacter sp. SK-11]HAY26977.1 ABC transporter substrate-binding protein [Accumulibacter sp.]HCN67622.1 ABC transporter substrate-binding protein [Accumulibacter sp.]HRL78059.1 extracellular solute-binding protein [Candidatus Accumulibacter phosphatis]HRQ97156.1 extracellular solute-binding protein [Candidatus Accumulibacter phosphatis]
MLLRKFLPTTLALALAVSMSSLAAAPAEILLSHQLDEERAERVEKVVERFNGSQKEYEVKLVRRVQGEPAKDLNLVTREEQGHFVAAKATFKPIQQIMTEAGVPFDGSKIAPELRVGLADAKGNLVALPIGLSTPILFINKSAFRKAGLDPEKPPRTWAETQQAADKLFDSGSTCPYTTSWPAWVHIDNLSAWNGVEVADAKGRLVFNGLPQVKHTALLTTWAKARFFIYFGRRDEADRRFAEGECGMLTSSSSLFGALHESRRADTGVSPLPYHDDVQGAPQQTLAGGSSLWAAAGRKPAEYKGIAQFVRFLMEPDLQVQLTAASGFLPMTAAARAAAGSKLLQADVAGLNIAYRQLQGPAALRTIRVSEIEKVRIIVEEELEAAWSGKTPAKEALDIAVQRGNLVMHAAPAAAKAPASKKK